MEPKPDPEKEKAQADARASLLGFTRHTWPGYRVNWHHELLCRELDRLVAGEILRLLIVAPPRHGKSELVSRRLPAHILGRDPDASIIACSYSADLASAMNRDVQRIIDTPAYAELYPDTALNAGNIRSKASGQWLRNSDIFEVVGRRGYYKSAGVGGPITGRGATYGIIDDPIKNHEEAHSQTYRDRLWEWYGSTFYTRLEKDARVLLTLTRWHEDDLAGRLLRLAQSDPNADQWTVLRLPAIGEGKTDTDPREVGEPLWEDKYNAAALRRIQISVGSFDWAALYQGRPAPAAGGLFKTRCWRFWFHRDAPLPPVRHRLDNGEEIVFQVAPLPTHFDAELQSWDMSFKGLETSKSGAPDFVVGGAWGRRGADCFLRDQVRGQWDLVQTIAQLLQFADKWPAILLKLVEDKANGPAVISTLRHRVMGLVAVEPEGDKVARARSVTPLVESGNVYLPHPSIAPWVWDFIHEAASFPGGRNDDQVDQMTQALRRFLPAAKEEQEKQEPQPFRASVSGEMAAEMLLAGIAPAPTEPEQGTRNVWRSIHEET